MKKILHIQVLPKLCGVQRVSLETLKNLSNEEYEKWILFSDELDVDVKQRCLQAFEQYGINVLFSKHLRRSIGFKDIAATVEIFKLCRREKFDIVHTHSTKPGIVGRIAATLARTPLVIHTIHGLAFHKFVKFPKWQFYWCCEMIASLFCHKIVMVNKYYGKYFGWFKSKLTTIYNGIDFSQLVVKSDTSKFEKTSNKILFIGRLDEPKDPLTLLQAAKEVVKIAPDTQFTLVGDGEKYEECKVFIEQNNLTDNVLLEGWKNDTSTYYSTHHIFCSPSIYEAFGLVFIEAGFYKLPTVATTVEGIPEVVVDNETGFLVPARNSELLAEKLLMLIKDKQLCQKIGQRAHDRVLYNFTAEKMVKEYIKIYSRRK